MAHGLRLQLGPTQAPVALTVPSNSVGWKVKKTKFTWKSAKGDPVKASVVIDTAKRTLAITLSGFDFPGPATASVRLLFASGDDAGGLVADWVEKKTGNFAPPKP